MRRPRVSLALAGVLAFTALQAAPASASPPDQSNSRTGNNFQTTHDKNGDCFKSTIQLSGTIQGIDGKAVNAFIGMDLQDAKGAGIDGGGCSGAKRDLSTTTYGVTVHVNYQLTANGVDPSTPGATTTWTAVVPSNTAKVYFEVTPKDASSRSEIGITDQTYYGNTMRPAVTITSNPQTIGPLVMPLNLCGNLSTGTLRGTATKNGKRVNITYASAFSQVNGSGTPGGLGPYGYNNEIYPAAGVGVYSLPYLASGNGKGQAYTIVADYTDGTKDSQGNLSQYSKQFYMYDARGVQHAGIFACKATTFNLTF